ncbi:MAG TPA: DUF1801 domain-containing protein [Anaerolineales bacterium]
MDASAQIDQRIKETKDWRGKLMARLRKLIHEADSEITEEWKWGSPIFSHGGMICSLGAFKDHVKVHFFKGAALADPKKLFNAGLDAKAMRAIDFKDGDKVDEKAFKQLIAAGVAYNTSKKK